MHIMKYAVLISVQYQIYTWRFPLIGEKVLQMIEESMLQPIDKSIPTVTKSYAINYHCKVG